MEEITDLITDTKAKFAVVDSIQTCGFGDIDQDPGSIQQVDAAILRLYSMAKEKKVTMGVVCHLNKAGEFHGTGNLQHVVDAVIRFNPLDEREGPDKNPATSEIVQLAVLDKNRYGKKSSMALLEMTDHGLATLSLSALKAVSLSASSWQQW